MSSAMPIDVQFVVIAREPQPGRVKTRLSPPCTPTQAALIASSSLADTFAAVIGTASLLGAPVTLALDGLRGPWIPSGVAVIDQEGDGLDERLTAAFTRVFAARPTFPAIIVGMDTPQLTSTHLLAVVDALQTHDAVLGPATDGGYWAIGLRHLHPRAIVGVPMSTDHTRISQIEQLVSCGYRVGLVDELADVDDMDDARAVAATIPESSFAAAVASVDAASSVAGAQPRSRS